MAPHSPGTDQIDTLLWIGIVVAAIVVVAVNVALLYAVRRFRAERGVEPRQVEGGRGLQLRVGAALTAFAAVVFTVSVIFTSKAQETPATGSAGLTASASAEQLEEDGEALTIKVTGQQWLWRYDYPNGAFSYYKLVVPVDTAVELELVTTDVIHNWDVPSLSGKREAVPGKVHRVTFKADEEGLYDGSSATLSGQAYAAMRTAVEAVSPEEYVAYTEKTKKDIETAQEQVVGLIEEGEVP